MKTEGVNVYLTIDREQEGWDGHVGFVPAYLEELGFDTNKTALLCGPPIMIKFCLASLVKMGFSKEQVYTTLELRMKCGVGKCGPLQHRLQIRLQGRPGLPLRRDRRAAERILRKGVANMENMVNVYFFGKRYSVPADLTIMTAMEYAGYTLKRGCGCRHGFCGACATIYRIKGDNELKTCLACQTQVQEGMYVASIPFFPTDKRLYDINEIKPNQQIMMELYPEIYSCIGCNACTKACTQNLNVMQYIAYGAARRAGEVRGGILRLRQLRLLLGPLPGGHLAPDGRPARKDASPASYIAPESKHLEKRVEEIHSGAYDELIEQIMQKPITEMQELYNTREIEK